MGGNRRVREWRVRGEGQILKKLIKKNAAEQRSEGGRGAELSSALEEGFRQKGMASAKVLR